MIGRTNALGGGSSGAKVYLDGIEQSEKEFFLKTESHSVTENAYSPSRSSGHSVVFNNEIHRISRKSNSDSTEDHTIFNGESWRVCDVPLPDSSLSRQSIIVYNGEMYLACSDSTSKKFYLYSFDGESWSLKGADTLSFAVSGDTKLFEYNGVLYALFYDHLFCSYDGTTFRTIKKATGEHSNLFYLSFYCVFNDNDKVYGVKGITGSKYAMHEVKVENDNIVATQICETSYFSRAVKFMNGEIALLYERAIYLWKGDKTELLINLTQSAMNNVNACGVIGRKFYVFFASATTADVVQPVIRLEV